LRQCAARVTKKKEFFFFLVVFKNKLGVSLGAVFGAARSHSIQSGNLATVLVLPDYGGLW
jgi:hypothetical protein